METVKYICEFFFGNFWHWLGLVIALEVVFSGGLVRFIRLGDIIKDKKED